MENLKTQNVFSATDFRNNFAKYLEMLQQNESPLVLTQNGKSVAVVVAPEVYDTLIAKVQDIIKIERGLRDIENGNVIAHEEFKAEMEARFNEAKVGG